MKIAISTGLNSGVFWLVLTTRLKRECSRQYFTPLRKLPFASHVSIFAAGNFAFPAAFFIVESLDALKLAHKFLLLRFDTHIGGARPVSGRIVGVAGVGDYEQ